MPIPFLGMVLLNPYNIYLQLRHMEYTVEGRVNSRQFNMISKLTNILKHLERFYKISLKLTFVSHTKFTRWQHNKVTNHKLYIMVFFVVLVFPLLLCSFHCRASAINQWPRMLNKLSALRTKPLVTNQHDIYRELGLHSKYIFVRRLPHRHIHSSINTKFYKR